MTDQHKHCPMCGTPMPMSEKFCSPKCEQTYNVNQNKVNRTRKILYVAFAVFILVWLYYMLVR
jgi:predicted nucleic acid-binding Zn ribbon protein